MRDFMAQILHIKRVKMPKKKKKARIYHYIVTYLLIVENQSNCLHNKELYETDVAEMQ